MGILTKQETSFFKVKKDRYTYQNQTGTLKKATDICRALLKKNKKKIKNKQFSNQLIKRWAPYTPYAYDKNPDTQKTKK